MVNVLQTVEIADNVSIIKRCAWEDGRNVRTRQDEVRGLLLRSLPVSNIKIGSGQQLN